MIFREMIAMARRPEAARERSGWVADLLVVAAIGFALLSVETARATSYDISPLSSFARAYGIGPNGEVVGSSGFGWSMGSNRGLIWTANNGAQDLGVQASSSYAMSLSSSGAVAGYGSTGAFLWTPSDGVRSLGSAGSRAYGINASGQVVGVSSNTATLWSSSSMQGLGTLPGGTTSTAVAINTSGSVVGYAGTATGPHAFLWTTGGGMQDLGVMSGGSASAATGINDAGQVIGYGGNFVSTSRAFLWTVTGGFQDIGALPGDTFSYAKGINNNGEIVGYSNAGWGTADHPYLWSHGSLIDLNTLLPSGSPWVLNQATAINDLGQIIGIGSYNGTSSVFFLTQVSEVFIIPEPRTVMLFGVCLAGMGLASAWRRTASR